VEAKCVSCEVRPELSLFKVILDKAKPHTENIKGLNLAAVIYTTVQVSRLLQDVSVKITSRA
jgi:hypothetical protein